MLEALHRSSTVPRWGVRLIHPASSDDVDLPRAYAYPDGPWSGSTWWPAPTAGAWLKGLSGGLSGGGDRRIFGMLRGLADVVVAGAATVRTEGYGPARAARVVARHCGRAARPLPRWR